MYGYIEINIKTGLAPVGRRNVWNGTPSTRHLNDVYVSIVTNSKRTSTLYIHDSVYEWIINDT